MAKTMADGIRYIVVNLPRTKATVAADVRSKVLKVIECSNRDFCTKFGIAVDDCPPYCKVIVEAKNHLFNRGRVKAAIYEITSDGFGY